MLAALTIPKLYSYRNILKTLCACLLISGLVAHFYRMNIPFANPPLFSQASVPLLLNSGEVQTKEAEVSIVIWLENEDIPNDIWTKLPTLDWVWTYNQLLTGPEKVVTLSGHQLIDKNEERDLFTWYTYMQKALARTGGLIYIDERIEQAMDISAYLSKTNALPAQWYFIDNMVSIAAYQDNFLINVLAGHDRINIQLLSRGKNNEGRTVLAIPALLQEF